MTTKRTSTLSFLAAIVLITSAAGCGADFDPASYLQGLRVLALIADPLEVGPSDELSITPVVYLSEGESISSSSLGFCPFSLGPTAGYECAVPACEIELSADQNGRYKAVPYELTLQCMSQLGTGDLPKGVPAEIPERVDVYFSYLVSSSLGEVRQAVLKLGLYTRGPPPVVNRAPLVSFMAIDETPIDSGGIAEPVTEGQQVEIQLQVDPASLDSFTDQAGNTKTEEAIVSFYANAGRFDYSKVSGSDARVTWKAVKLEPGQTHADVYVTVRDLRGGQAVFGPVTIPIVR